MDKGICSGCEKEKYIQNKTKNLCSDCIYKRSHQGKTQIEVQYEKNREKSEQRNSISGTNQRDRNKVGNYNSKSSIRRKGLKTTGEREMFLEIWEERPHFCTNPKCRTFLGNEPKTVFFSHIKPKSVYSELRLVKSNVRLLCFSCHFDADHRGIKIEDEEE
jgi:hypothetical protein